LYILKEYQRQGIGKDFFDIARKQVKSNGFTDFFLSVNTQNYTAQKFYQAMGGTVISKNDMQIKYKYSV